MGCSRSCKRDHKSADQSRVIRCLVNGNDQAGIDNHQKKIRQRPVSLLSDQSDFITKIGKKHDEKHFEQLVKD